LRQLNRISLTLPESHPKSLATGSREVAQNVVNLQVHLAKRFLHMQDVLGGHLQQTCSMSPEERTAQIVHAWAEAWLAS